MWYYRFLNGSNIAPLNLYIGVSLYPFREWHTGYPHSAQQWVEASPSGPERLVGSLVPSLCWGSWGRSRADRSRRRSRPSGRGCCHGRRSMRMIRPGHLHRLLFLDPEHSKQKIFTLLNYFISKIDVNLTFSLEGHQMHKNNYCYGKYASFIHYQLIRKYYLIQVLFLC